MLLSRDDILAVYASSGRETLQLLTSRITVADGSLVLKDPLRAGTGVQATGDDKEPTHGDGKTGPSRDLARAALSESLKERRAANRRIRHLANHDPLTGLCNRSHFQNRFAKALKDALLSGNKVAFALMGLDNFKDVNSSFGHQAGDTLLVEVGQRIKALLGARDAASRFGGDEFALLLTGLLSSNDVEPISARLLEAVSAAVPRHAPQHRSSASLGIALYPDHGSDVGELMLNADIALNQAKAGGKGQIKVFDPDMRTAMTRRLKQLSTFRTLLETGSLRPFYQPQIRLSDRRSHGFEALARCVLPSGEILYPRDFQAALEEPETAILLGEHMLESVSDDVRQWRETQMPACKVSINVTAPELKRGDYAEKVSQIFLAKGIPLSTLTVEVTESVLLDEYSQVAETLSDLRRLGVSISLDDFGTGFASLTHLKSLEVNQIKIDRSFVTDLPANADDRAIVRATLGMARSLGIETVAEGLEDEDQLKSLRMLGCDFGQGFLFSPAVPAEQAEAYFRRNRAYRKAVPPHFAVPQPMRRS